MSHSEEVRAIPCECGPLISVAIVCFNGERHIARCLKSLCEQEFRDFEIIVVDNHSADRSVELLRQYPQVKLIVNPVNNGSTGGNNLAIAAARGK